MTSLDTRNIERESLFLMAEIAAPGAPRGLRVKVRNLSPGGMMAVSDQRMECGMQIAVELRNIGAVSGRVVWVDGDRFGVSFESTIDPKRARFEIAGGETEAPGYARPMLSAPKYDDWNGKLRRV